MSKGIRNALLFAVGALVAAFLVAYGAGVFTRAPAPAGTASAPDSVPASPESSATSKEGRLPPGAEGQKEEQKTPEPVTVTDPTQISPPTFDVVRVEGNGSIVIAGKSVPNSKVEILAGSNVLATALSGPGGDFASVLDTPLKPGDYQLVLRSTTPANIVAMSKETAVVSIPEHPGGQVLALVEAPGEPSKLITVPEPAKPGTEAGGAAATGTKPGDGAAPGSQTVPGAAPGSAAAPSGQGATGKPAEEKSTDAKPEAPAAPGSAGTESGQPAAGSGAVATAPGTASGETGRPAAAPVSVEAVEIEGNKVFVAGTAKAGSTVRVYANDVILGEARTSPVGRFLVEAIHELAVGDYIIRADMLSADGTRVEARAAVPFTREPGEAVAAVAQGAEPARGGAQAPQQQPGATQQPGAAGTAPSGSAAAPAMTEPPAPGAASGERAASPGAAPSPSVAQPGSAVLPPLGGKIIEEPPTIVAPKLQEVMGAVIIRRGDTLWRISRRVYGHGIRYSTIYLANQDQIADPDRIWPGQVFTVPDKSSQGEPADLSKIGGQATTVTRPAE